MVTTVAAAVTGACSKLAFAVGARFRPIRATMAPVTTGGMATWIQREPARWTTAPIRASAAPAIRMPPRAPAAPCWLWAAAMGAMKAKLEPR